MHGRGGTGTAAPRRPDRPPVADELGLAVRRSELELRFQPVVDMPTGRVEGFEALVRWRHPRWGLLGADHVVVPAEASGAIVGVGAWVLEQACLEAATWSSAPGVPAPVVGVNASGVEVSDPAYPGRVRGALDRSGLDPGRLVIEVTETAAIGDLAAAGARLSTLRDLGVRVAVDDFGTGFSSMRYLDLLPVDVLKIDRSFLAGVDPTGGLPAVVRRHLDVAGSRGLEVLAEGVERSAQRAGLCAAGVRLGQGYLFSPPLEPGAARRFLGTSLTAAAAARTAETAAGASVRAAREPRRVAVGA